MLGAVGISAEEGEVNLNRSGRRKFLLGLLGFVLDALHRGGVVLDVNAGLLLELVNQEVDEDVIKVFTTEVGVAVGGFHFKDTVADFQDGDIKGATTKVKDGDLFVFLAFQAVGEGGSGGLVDDALDLKASDLASVFGSLALRVVKVGRDGDDSFGDFLAEEGFGISLDLGENHRGDFFGGVVLAVKFHGDAAALLDDFVGHNI